MLASSVTEAQKSGPPLQRHPAGGEQSLPFPPLRDGRIAASWVDRSAIGGMTASVYKTLMSSLSLDPTLYLKQKSNSHYFHSDLLPPVLWSEGQWVADGWCLYFLGLSLQIAFLEAAWPRRKSMELASDLAESTSWLCQWVSEWQFKLPPLLDLSFPTDEIEIMVYKNPYA